jgi:hypothetical protein
VYRLDVVGTAAVYQGGLMSDGFEAYGLMNTDAAANAAVVPLLDKQPPIA